MARFTSATCIGGPSNIPTYLPGDVAKHTDFDAGKDKGRIYRLSAKSNARNSEVAEGCQKNNG